MGRIFEALEHLSSVQNGEALDGFRRYESELATVLRPRQMQRYADHLHETQTLRIFEEMTPQELTMLPPEVQLIAVEIIANTNLSLQNRRVAALLHQYGDPQSVPDFSTSQARL